MSCDIAACAFCGSRIAPVRCIFFIALASSGFERSIAAVDAFWSQRFRIGTFDMNAKIGRRYLPPWIRPSSASMPSSTSRNRRIHTGISSTAKFAASIGLMVPG